MNLLVGLAVSDIGELMKTGIRDQLIAQIELISLVRNFQKCFIIQARLLNIVNQCSSQSFKKIEKQTVSICHTDLNDRRYPEELKHLLHNYCNDKKRKEKEDLHNTILEEIHDRLDRFKDIHDIQKKCKEIHEKFYKFEEMQNRLMKNEETQKETFMIQEKKSEESI